MEVGSGSFPIRLMGPTRPGQLGVVLHVIYTDDSLAWLAMDSWPADWVRDRIAALRSAASELEEKADELGL